MKAQQRPFSQVAPASTNSRPTDGRPLLVAGVAWLWTRRGGRDGGRSDAPSKGEAVSFVALPAVAMQPDSSSPALTAMATASSQPPPPPPRPAWYAVPMAALCTASLGSALFYARARPEAGYFTTHTPACMS